MQCAEIRKTLESPQRKAVEAVEENNRRAEYDYTADLNTLIKETARNRNLIAFLKSLITERKRKMSRTTTSGS